MASIILKIQKPPKIGRNRDKTCMVRLPVKFDGALLFMELRLGGIYSDKEHCRHIDAIKRDLEPEGLLCRGLLNHFARKRSSKRVQLCSFGPSNNVSGKWVLDSDGRA
mgnify:CR=1 FL=1